MRVTVLILLAILAHGAAADCVPMTEEIGQMDVRNVRLAAADGRQVDLEVRVADSGRERAAGFQHVCPETADAVSILFLFSQSVTPRFHMKNVYMPLDIAFIDNTGEISSIQTMRPYVSGAREKKLWGPPAPVVAALEVRAGLFRDLGVEANEWTLTLQH